jgi:hypothetical protein
MVSAMVGVGAVMITVMRIFVDPSAPMPSVLAMAIVLVVLVASAVLIRLVGYSVPPLPEGLSPEQAVSASLRHYTSTTTLRTAIAEAPVLVAFAVSFTFQPHSWLPLLIALPGALALWWLHAWPSPRTAAALEESLEANGTESHLSESLGFR